MGLLLNDTAANGGYYLFRQMQFANTYLIDEYGREVHRWDDASHNWWGTPYLLENGHLLIQASPPNGIHLVEFDWGGNMVWEFESPNAAYKQHHDIEPLPNGNILVLATDFISKTEMAQAGRDTSIFAGAVLWSEMILEIEPSGSSGGTIVWQWRLWDHLIQETYPLRDNYGVVAEHPELLDLNWGILGSSDWIHANGIDYNDVLDQIVISSRNFSEFWIIDHSTTTAEAATHSGGARGMGGDILYRWGNPQTYDAGNADDQILDHQHDANWIESDYPGEGNILVFNNGTSINHYSTVIELTTTADSGGNYARPSQGTPHAPSTPNWEWTDQPPDATYANFISAARRLKNGNTLITVGPDGDLREVSPTGELLWNYIVPIRSTGPLQQGTAVIGNDVFRAFHFDSKYSAFDSITMIAGSAIEQNPISFAAASTVPATPATSDTMIAVVVEVGSVNSLTGVAVMVDLGNGFEEFQLFDDGLNLDGAPGDGVYGARIGAIDESSLVEYYFIGEDSAANTVYDPPNPPNSLYRFTVTQGTGVECGNIDGQSSGGAPTDISDLTYLVDYLFNGGPPPADMGAADVNGSGGSLPVDIADLTYLVDFLFGGGPSPDCN